MTRLTVFAFFALGAFATAAGQAGSGYGHGRGGGNGPAGREACCISAPSAPLSADEAKWLAYMREEERLARDVYEQLYGKWKLRIFANIARSEQRHFEAVGRLIAAYGIKDPAAAAQPGVFAEPALAALYQRLTAEGAQSVKAALQAGLEIEKADIAELESALKAAAKSDLKAVFANLLAGSLNHQEAFENMLEVLP